MTTMHMGQAGHSDLLQTEAIAKSRLLHMHEYLYLLWHQILSYVNLICTTTNLQTHYKPLIVDNLYSHATFLLLQ